jgi:acetamidase/formamidase
MVRHRLDADGRTLHGTFSPDRAPVLTVDPGDSVVFTTLDSGWSIGPWRGDAHEGWERHPAWSQGDGHALTGPVAVRGVEPGDTLEVRVVDVRPGAYGTTFAGGRPTPYNERYRLTEESTVLRWTLDPAARLGVDQYGHVVALRPFMGVLGMPPPEPGEHSTIPPRRWGGNLDCRELVAGSTLFLPVPVADALFSVGDGHAAQGDGEVSGTAIECPMEWVELAFHVRRDLPMTGPVARTGDGTWITMGLGDTLDDAAHQALDAMFSLLGRLHGLSRPDAVALASVVVDLRVTQIVNQVMGAHAVLPAGAVRRRSRPGDVNVS